MSAKNLAIATLSVLVVVLVCTLALLNTFEENTAFARSMSQQTGGLIVTTMMVNNESEAVVITDASRNPGRMNLYFYDINANSLVLTDILDLDEQNVFGVQPAPEEQPGSNVRTRRQRRPARP
jgi:hypothetical protein